MTPPVSQATEGALRAAMKRLLEGTSVHTDGRLTIANLAREAKFFAVSLRGDSD